MQNPVGMINKGDTLLFRTGLDEKDVGLVVRVHTVRRDTVYIVDNGYTEEQVSPKQVLQVLKAVPSRRRPSSAPAGSLQVDEDAKHQQVA